MENYDLKSAKLILEVDIDGREAKIEFDLTDEEMEKVMEVMQKSGTSSN